MANIVKFELTNAGHSKVESLMQSSMRREDLSDVSNLLVVHYISAREGIGDEQYETRLEEFFGGPEKFHTTLEKAEDQGYVSIYRMRDMEELRDLHLEEQFSGSIFGTQLPERGPVGKTRPPSKKNWNQLRSDINKKYAKAKTRIDKQIKSFKTKWKTEKDRDYGKLLPDEIRGLDVDYEEGLRPLVTKSDKLYEKLLKDIRKLKDEEDFYNKYGR